MTDLDTIFKGLEIVSIIGSAALLMYRAGRMTERFEQVGLQQADEISQIKISVEKLNKLAEVTNALLVSDARKEERMNAMDQRQLVQGQRIDEFQRAFFKLMGERVGA